MKGKALSNRCTYNHFNGKYRERFACDQLFFLVFEKKTRRAAKSDPKRAKNALKRQKIGYFLKKCHFEIAHFSNRFKKNNCTYTLSSPCCCCQMPRSIIKARAKRILS